MKRTVIAMGLPKTGKTTFLAAFWHAVGTGEVVGSLKMAKTFGDMEYLNQIREAWADCKPIGRTGPAADKPVTIVLEDTEAHSTVSLEWTDMIGERFERQWSDREWTRGYQQLVDSAIGVLLFIHPYTVRQSELIIDAQKTIQRIGIEAAGQAVEAAANAPTDSVVDGQASTKSEKAEPFERGKVPTQAQLVELLQFVDIRRETGGQMRVAVVASAWDVIKAVSGDITPEAWMAKSMPLLHQFMEANDDHFAPRIYGVSAQGGDYKDADALRRAHHLASNRIEVVYGSTPATHDITTPVRWAIGMSSGT